MTTTRPDDRTLDAHRTRSNIRTMKPEHDVATADTVGPTSPTTTTSNTPTPITTEERR